jgi:hypothetical protein
MDMPTSELAEMPFSFSQRQLLSESQFERELQARGVPLGGQQLEALHRCRLLVPLLRVSRDTRAIRRAFTRDDPGAWNLAYFQPTSPPELAAARASGHLHDPSRERVLPAPLRRRVVNGREYQTSVYLYSEAQMILLPDLKMALPHVTYTRNDDRVVAHLGANRTWRESWLESVAKLRRYAIAVIALEAAYYPDLIGRARFERHEQFTAYETWRRNRPIREVLTRLGVKADWFATAAAFLRATADRVDPLVRWTELIAHAQPDTWFELRGAARIAIDLRISAELLLRYYEDLAKARQAMKLPSIPSNRPDGRLRPRRSLDEVLTQFGLSPHPRLVLVVEGDTELLLIPRVMNYFEMKINDDTISIENAEGVGRDLSALMSFLAPRVAAEAPDGYLELTRPATRVLVVFDPEGPAATAEGRKKLQNDWIERILRVFPREYRTDAVREQVTLLVEVTTWNTKSESFEFAHFTDRQIASAMLKVPGWRRKHSIAEMSAIVAGLRMKRANLATAVPSGRKLVLAEQLWPILETKLRRAEARKTADRIPVVGVLDHALDLAQAFPRRGLVINVGATSARAS